METMHSCSAPTCLPLIARMPSCITSFLQYEPRLDGCMFRPRMPQRFSLTTATICMHCLLYTVCYTHCEQTQRSSVRRGQGVPITGRWRVTQACWKVTPSYHLRQTHGPDHAKTFEVEVRMNGKSLAVASGSSKKEAEQNAACAAIQTVG